MKSSGDEMGTTSSNGHYSPSSPSKFVSQFHCSRHMVDCITVVLSAMERRSTSWLSKNSSRAPQATCLNTFRSPIISNKKELPADRELRAVSKDVRKIIICVLSREVRSSVPDTALLQSERYCYTSWKAASRRGRGTEEGGFQSYHYHMWLHLNVTISRFVLLSVMLSLQRIRLCCYGARPWHARARTQYL